MRARRPDGQNLHNATFAYRERAPTAKSQASSHAQLERRQQQVFNLEQNKQTLSQLVVVVVVVVVGLNFARQF